MLTLFMWLLVLGVTGTVVLRNGLDDGTDKRATTPPRRRGAPLRKLVDSRPPLRAGAVLMASVAGIGVVAGLVLGVALVLLALLLHAAVGA